MLADSECRMIEKALRDLLNSMQRANGFKTFAACHTCRFNQKHDGRYYCGLTQEPFMDREVVQICREHQCPLMAGTK
jgi:hypothetical protein